MADDKTEPLENFESWLLHRMAVPSRAVAPRRSPPQVSKMIPSTGWWPIRPGSAIAGRLW